MNYMLVGRFEMKDSPAASAATTRVGKLVEDGTAARYDTRDLATAERTWEEAARLADAGEPATPMERYQIHAGLGMIHVERKDYAKARPAFRRAVEAARGVEDNFKPLAYSNYNLACTEALLGEKAAAIESLRAALAAERKTDRRRYTKMALEDESLASLRNDEAFRRVLEEFPDDPNVSACGPACGSAATRAATAPAVPGAPATSSPSAPMTPAAAIPAPAAP